MLTSSSLDAVAYVSESSAFMQATPLALPATARSALPERSFASPDNAALADVLRHPGIWRRGSKPAPTSDAPSTGLAELDARLPGSGWPRGGLTEILIEHDGIGECSLLLPALAALTRARQRVVLIAPPYIPYAPALAEAGIDLSQLVHIEAGVADTHWTAEQCLRAGCCGAVVRVAMVLDGDRLHQGEAETGAALAFVFRPLAAAQEASPAALRLKITVSAGERRIEILKCRGALGGSQAIGQRA